MDRECAITEFRGKYYFLSNFYEAPVTYCDRTYRNNEAAFQAQKCVCEKDRKRFENLPPNEAKSLGRRIKLRNHWDRDKDFIMFEIVQAKFEQNHDLAQKLLDTGNKELVEGNNWGDKYWGVCCGVGLNKLGKILKRVRRGLRTEAGWTVTKYNL